MTVQLQLNNENWEQIYNDTFQVVSVSDKLFVPFQEIIIPTPINKHIIAVYINTEIPQGAKWNYAGHLIQRLNLGLSVGTESSFDEFSRRKLFLNRIKLIIFPKVSDTYTLSFELPEWFKTAKILIWQYLGSGIDSTESLIYALRSDITRLEQKIDDISNYSSGS